MEKTVRKRVHSCMCRSVTIGDILNFGITADVFLYARRLEIKLTYSLMFGETAICYHSGFVLFETKETEVTIMILCNISDIICVCFVFTRDSLSHLETSIIFDCTSEN